MKPRLKNRHAVRVDGRMPRPGDEPIAARRKKRRVVIDVDALEEAKANLQRQAEDVASKRWAHSNGANALPAIGVCHECGRRVSGERRFCGPHAAARDTKRGAA